MCHGLEEKKINYFKLEDRQAQEAQSKSKSLKSVAQIEKDKYDAKWTTSKVTGLINYLHPYHYKIKTMIWLSI